MGVPLVIPSNVAFIIETLNNSRFEAFIVGGCVRDFVMGKKPKDWDIATSATPQEVKALFPKTFDTGIAHGTVTVLVGKVGYEVTTYRIDGVYTDSRHPDSVMFTTRLEEDLLRRDFTMNAIAYHKTIGFVDPFHGVKDIEAGIIRGVGDASKRFQEDALRMLRAVRFCAQLDFKIESGTYDALLKNAHRVAHVSIERIRDEMLKTLLTDKPERFSLLVESKLMSYIDKKTESYFAANLEKVVSFIQKCDKNTAHRLSLLFMHSEPPEIMEIMKFFRFDNKTVKEVALLTHWLFESLTDDFYAVRKTVNAIGHEHFESVCYLKSIVCEGDLSARQVLENIKQKHAVIMENKDCCTLSQLAINGETLMRLGVSQGKQIGETLQFLLDEVMHKPEKNDCKTLEELALKRYSN